MALRVAARSAVALWTMPLAPSGGARAAAMLMDISGSLGRGRGAWGGESGGSRGGTGVLLLLRFFCEVE